MAGIGAPELIIILVILLVIFGGAKLPKLAKSLGEARREFEKSADDEPPRQAVEPASLSSKEEELRQREEAVRRREDEVRRPGGEHS